jgi:hypothetical protein
MVSPRRAGQQRRVRRGVRKPESTQQAAVVQSSPPRRLPRVSTRPTSRARPFKARSPGRPFRKANAASNEAAAGHGPVIKTGADQAISHPSPAERAISQGRRPPGSPVSTRPTSPLRARRGSPVASTEPHRNASRLLPGGLNPPVGTTTERDPSARLLSNKTTSPIHLDLDRAPIPTIAGRPYNAWCFSCKG